MWQMNDASDNKKKKRYKKAHIKPVFEKLSILKKIVMHLLQIFA